MRRHCIGGPHEPLRSARRPARSARPAGNRHRNRATQPPRVGAPPAVRLRALFACARRRARVDPGRDRRRRGAAVSIQASPAAVKRALIGPPRATGEMHETLLSKKLALPIFASDPLSSVAYATEAALVVLVAASAASAHLVLPISLAISVVLAIVVVSYTQTVQAYQTSGGAYVVAKDNLGTLPGLVAAAALLVDYVLTVAVSVAAGVLALTSAAPSLEAHKVGLSLVFIALLTLANLRAVRESGTLSALPTYAFVVAMYALVATGVGKCVVGTCPQAHVPDPVAAGVGTVGALVVIRAFASGAV